MIGRPLIILPYTKPGCLDRLRGLVLRWAGRLVWVGVGFAIGWGVASCT